MKLFRRMVIMLCALAMVLTLAPCAFADDATDSVDTEVKVIDDVVTGDSELTVEYKEPSGYLNVTNSGDLEVAKNGKIEVESTKSGAKLEVSKNESENGSLTNNGTITVTGKGPSLTWVNCGGDLKNSNEITVTGGSARVESGKTLDNGGTITVTSTGTVRKDVEVTSGGEIINDGTIGVNSAGSASLTAQGGVLKNSGEVSLDAQRNTRLFADSIENEGEINLSGKYIALALSGGEEIIMPGANYISENQTIKNYGTISITSSDESPESINGTYYGVNLEDTAGNKTSLLTSWKDGKENNLFERKIDFDSGSRDGYVFKGWDVNGTTYQTGQTANFTIIGVTNIKALWEAIINNTPAAPTEAAPSGCEVAEKDYEEIKEFVEAKVLDADRREMTMETEYYQVARTSYHRLIVLFSQEQLDAMESGVHLFYIITPDGTEVEYTLSIA